MLRHFYWACSERATFLVLKSLQETISEHSFHIDSDKNLTQSCYKIRNDLPRVVPNSGQQIEPMPTVASLAAALFGDSALLWLESRRYHLAPRTFIDYE